MATTIALDWDDIALTEEFIDDLALLTDIIVDSLGLDRYIDGNNPFVYAIAFLSAMERYYIRHISDCKDIDTTPFIELILAEVGQGIPVVTNIPIVEFIREAKSWAGHKGTIGLYQFIGQLVGSPIEVDVPATKIFTLDSTDVYLDGASSAHGLLPFAESKVGYIRDGIYYAHYTYVVNVLQSQKIGNFNDLIALLDNVHPAGFQEFLVITDADSGASFVPVVADIGDGFSAFNLSTSSTTGKPFPGLDNGFFLDSDTLLDQEGGPAFLGNLYIQEVFGNAYAFAGRTIVTGQQMHPSFTESENSVFTRITDSLTNVTPTSIWASVSGGATETAEATIPASQEPTIAIGGTVTTGGTITVTIYDSMLPGGQEVITYTVDTAFNYMAQAFASAVDFDSTLHTAGIIAFAFGPRMVFTYTDFTTTIVPSLSGGALLTATLDARQAINSTIEIDGLVTVGDVITVTVLDSGLAGGTESVSYTVLLNDGLFEIAVGLTAAINADTNLAAIRVGAISPFYGSILQVSSASSNATTYSYSLSMSATETVTIITNVNASMGLTLGGTMQTGDVLTLAFNNAEIISGPHDLPLDVDDPSLYLTTDQVTGGLTRLINTNVDLYNLFNGDTPCFSVDSSIFFTYFFFYTVIDPINAFDPSFTDSYLLPNQQTNMSMSIMKYESIMDLTYVEVLSVAYALDGQNPPTVFFADLPTCTILQSIA